MQMVKPNFEVRMKEIIQSISDAGFDPFSQLYGYLTTGKEEYITRTGNARELIKTLNWQQVWDYVKEMEKSE
ncbi:MAG: IreB family regulatory phosphoprotein [Bacteroidaceae bacterium]|nr:IreB family regulatory phosphoprotein [Bacteroidaceae bacterium]